MVIATSLAQALYPGRPALPGRSRGDAGRRHSRRPVEAPCEAACAGSSRRRRRSRGHVAVAV